jgi:hypothetical protein
MKSKIVNLLLLITSLLGYLEWGRDKHLFLFQAEGEIFSKLFTEPLSVLHPFTILPLVAQVMLIVTLFQKKPSKVLTYMSIGGLGVLLVLMFVIGIMSVNFKILFSTFPFIVVAILAIRHFRNLNDK